MCDWEIEISRNINKDDIIPIHDEYIKDRKKVCSYFINDDPDYLDNSFYDFDNYEYEHEYEIRNLLKGYYLKASKNGIIPSLYYRCFSIENLKLTSNEHMHILALLHHKIYCVYSKMKYLKDARYMDIKKGKFINKEIKKTFKALYKEYCKLTRYLVNIFFMKIKTRFHYLTYDDYETIEHYLANHFSPESVRNVEKEKTEFHHIFEYYLAFYVCIL